MRTRLIIATFVVVLALAWMPRPGWAQSCDAPQVLVVLDQSSSMGERAPLDDGSLKWDAAVSALTELTSEYDRSVDFGLMLFPSAGECTPGVVNVPIGPGHADEIAAALPDSVPYSGNYTPMGESLYAAADVSALHDSSRRNYVILITDGWQWCDPYDASTRFMPVDATWELRGAGISTFVIGFSSSVDTLTLNRAAVAGGTALPGCDPDSDDYTRSDNCYYQVDDLAELRDALSDITAVITEEICDGLDNDCDGMVDEGLTRACATTCGAGVETCDDGVWLDCTAPEPETEICDGRDNDCDGMVDEGCDCVDGDTRRCGTDVGECESGTQECVDGVWGPCEGMVHGSAEVCDGLDNDCDGVIDPGCGCADGETRRCGPDEGECEPGMQECIDGVWSECTGATGPTDEVCDGVDNDCDGITDEGCNCIDGETQPCGLSEGECEEGTQVCIDGRWSECDGAVDPGDELCDGLDNDCNGLVDDGAYCEVGECVDGECVDDGDNPPPNPCEDVVCPPGMDCLDGTCVDPGGYEPPDDESDGTPTDPIGPGDGGGSGVGNSGCDCGVTGPASSSGGLALTALVGFALAFLRRRR